MHNFGRVLKLALRYRFTLIGVVVSSLMVAILWGGNIGGLFPVFKVVIQGKSLIGWIDTEVDASNERIAKLVDANEQSQQKIAAANDDEQIHLRNQMALNAIAIGNERKAIDWYQYVRPYVAKYAPQDPFQTVVWIIAALLIATAVKNVFIVANRMWVMRLTQLVIYDVRRMLFDHTLKMDMGGFSEERTSGLVSRFNHDIGVLHGGLISLFGGAVREPLKMVVCLAGAAIINWRLLGFSLLLIPLLGILINSLASSLKRANRRAMEELSQLVGVISETFTGIQTIQAYTLERARRARFLGTARECVNKAMRISLYSSLTKPVTEILGMGAVCISLVLGAYLVLNHETHVFGIRIANRPMDISTLLVFYGLLIGAADPARRLTDVFSGIQGGVAAANRLFPLLDREPAVTDPPSPKSAPRPHRKLVFDNVHFGYEEDTPILRGIDLEIPFGETVAIVGPNGCGKTTLSNLIPRFYDPSTGAVRLDDVDLRELRLRDLRRSIGVVTQQTHLLDDTVMDNIRFGSLRASDEEVIAAARKAHAHRFIEEKLEDGYQTIVGQGGSRLSGGQRQRICLARAILRDPEILILDEATSQVDLESEELIHQVLAEFVKNRTAFIITHRLSTLALADRIIVMKGGQIDDMGTHEQLDRRCETYQRLHDIHHRRSA